MKETVMTVISLWKYQAKQGLDFTVKRRSGKTGASPRLADCARRTANYG